MDLILILMYISGLTIITVLATQIVCNKLNQILHDREIKRLRDEFNFLKK